MNSQVQVNTKRIILFVSIIVVIALVGLTASKSYVIVDYGNMGILTHWNAIDFVSPPLSPGFHFITPFQDGVIPLNIQVQAPSIKADAASKDLQIVSSQVTLNYHVNANSVNTLLNGVGMDYEAKIVQPAVQEVVKAATAKFNAEELIANRPLVKADIENTLTERLLKFNLVVDQVSITNFDFSPEFNTAIEKKVQAQQDALTAENTVRIKQAEAQQVVATAWGNANATIAQAEGDKQSRILQAEGEGKAIDITNQALAHNPNYLEWLKIKNWDGHLPGTLITSSNGGVPFINIPTGVTPTK
jgi:prohibitin 2